MKYLFLLIALLAPQYSYSFGTKAKDPVLDEVLTYKPSSNDASAAAKCNQLAKWADSKGIHTLIITFEGLASFNESSTQSTYVYHRNLLDNASTGSFSQGSTGYVLHGLMQPLISTYGKNFEFLVFPHDSLGSSHGSVPETCAEIWKSKANRRLILVGHSYGGHAASQLATLLYEDDTAVDSVITIDPRLRNYVGELQRYNNVKTWVSYYQTNTPFLNGYKVNGADTNIDLSYTGVSHTQMPYRPEVFRAVEDAL